MTSNRKTSIIVGILFITATAATILSLFFLDPILETSDYLVNISENTNLMVISALFMLIDAIAVAGIAITIYPVLKEQNVSIALGYVGARIVECVLFILVVLCTLLLMSLSQEFIKAGTPDSSYFQTVGVLLLAASDWAFSLGLGFIFALSAMILNYSLFKSKLIPRWLSGWGFVGAILVLIFHVFDIFAIATTDILNFPIALQEMAFAVWLIVKGFKK